MRRFQDGFIAARTAGGAFVPGAASFCRAACHAGNRTGNGICGNVPADGTYYGEKVDSICDGNVVCVSALFAGVWAFPVRNATFAFVHLLFISGREGEKKPLLRSVLCFHVLLGALRFCMDYSVGGGAFCTGSQKKAWVP